MTPTKSPVPPQRSCGTMPVHERLLRTDPAYLEARAASETRVWEYQNRMRASQRSGTTVIPVVVHVVFRTAAENISDAQVHSQIAVLNADYRRANADLSKLPSAFASLAADARIEFELATTDPAGQPTTGIVRTSTTATSFLDDDKVKHASSGGADAWPSGQYLNLWACALGNNLLGYAQFPGGPAATDGVVILNSAFGSTGTAAAPFNLGRTASHEIGHWLNLRHIWGDDGNGCGGDDLVADTPNAAGPNYGKPAFPHVTCSNGPNGDLFMNYMDYTDDDSMFMFTAGQVGRMQATLDGDRASIGHTTSGPTLSFGDTITLATSDHHATISKIDVQLTLAQSDLSATISLADHHPTIFHGDIQIATLAGGDQLPPPWETGDGDGGGDPWPIIFGTVAGQAVPFTLATGHHSVAWTGAHPELAATEVQVLQTQIAQYQQLLDNYLAVEAEGKLGTTEQAAAEQAHATYTRLVSDLRRLTSA